MRYQKEVDRLEAENKDLRKQLLLKEKHMGKKIKWKVKQKRLNSNNQYLQTQQQGPGLTQEQTYNACYTF